MHAGRDLVPQPLLTVKKIGIKCFPEKNYLDQVESCSHRSQEIKNSVTVISSYQDGFLACNKRNGTVLKARGYFEILPTLG